MGKDIVIGILVVLLIASVGVSVYFWQKSPLSLSAEASKELCDILPLYTGPEVDGSGFPPYAARDVCHFVFAAEKGDAKICGNMKTPDLQAQCYAVLAVKLNDSGLCASASAEARDRCYSQVASKLGGLAVCDKIQRADDRDNCLRNYASQSGDAEACGRISGIRMRDDCYMNQGYRDPSFCDKVSSSQMREDCRRNAGR